MKTLDLLELAAISGSAAILHVSAIRPSVFTWGATTDEITRSMYGDGILPNALLQTTRSITVHGRCEEIWSLLMQMGPRPRPGAYTYDWIERLLGIDIENVDRILPEHQHLDEGDAIGLNPKGEDLVVREVQPERLLVLQWAPAKSTWTFGLYATAGCSTRLVSRNRLVGSGLLFRMRMVDPMEPGSLVRERAMLRATKHRAERLGTGITTRRQSLQAH